MLLAAAAGQAADFRTPNFVVNAPTPELAQEMGQRAEALRASLAVEWLGRKMPDWYQPCPVRIQVGEQLGAGGETGFTFDQGEVFGWRMDIQGSRERLLDSVLPHEITHTVFASHFRQALPRWADEGACTTVEHASEQRRHERMLVQFLQNNRGLAFNRMFAMMAYPQDIMPLYAQGHSVARYLIEQGGKRKYVDFVGEGLSTRDWPAAVRNHYGVRDLGVLQTTWLAWVKEGSPPLAGLPSPASSVARVAFQQFGPSCATGNCPRHAPQLQLQPMFPALQRPRMTGPTRPAPRPTPTFKEDPLETRPDLKPAKGAGSTAPAVGPAPALTPELAARLDQVEKRLAATAAAEELKRLEQRLQEVSSLRAERGPPGEPGAKGERGPRGENGTPGQPGEAGQAADPKHVRELVEAGLPTFWSRVGEAALGAAGVTGPMGAVALIAWMIAGRRGKRRFKAMVENSTAVVAPSRPPAEASQGPNVLVVEPAQAPPLHTHSERTENRYVRVPEVSAEGEALRDAMAREVALDGRLAPYMERIESSAKQILHGKRVAARHDNP